MLKIYNFGGNMESKLAERLEKGWLKPKSIPIALALIIVVYFAFIAALGALDGITLTKKSYHTWCIVAFAVWCLHWYLSC